MQLSKKQRTRQVIGKDSARRQRKRQEKSLQQMLPPAVEAIPVDTIARRRGQYGASKRRKREEKAAKALKVQMHQADSGPPAVQARKHPLVSVDSQSSAARQCQRMDASIVQLQCEALEAHRAMQRQADRGLPGVQEVAVETPSQARQRLRTDADLLQLRFDNFQGIQLAHQNTSFAVLLDTVHTMLESGNLDAESGNLDVSLDVCQASTKQCDHNSDDDSDGPQAVLNELVQATTLCTGNGESSPLHRPARPPPCTPPHSNARHSTPLQ